MLPFGMTSKEKFKRYIKCLSNIKETSSITYVSGSGKTGQCSVGVIYFCPSKLYNLPIDRAIMFKSCNPDFPGFPFRCFNINDGLVVALEKRMGNAINVFKYASTDHILITKIDNTRK